MWNKRLGKQTGRLVTRELPMPAGGVRIETFLPWKLVSRGPRTRLITPAGAPQEVVCEAVRERPPRVVEKDTALTRAIGLAHHWQRLLDDQRVASVAEIAEAEGMDVTQVRRVMRLTLLAPEIVERLLASPDAVLDKVMRRPWPSSWVAQRQVLPGIEQPTLNNHPAMIL